VVIGSNIDKIVSITRVVFWDFGNCIQSADSLPKRFGVSPPFGGFRLVLLVSILFFSEIIQISV